MALAIKTDADRDVDITNPSKNGIWNFVVAEGVIEKDKKMNKLIISTPIMDIRDLTRYSVTISNDGLVVYAKSPIAPTYLIEDYENVYKDADDETKLGHSVYATKFGGFNQNQRTETVAYRLPAPVCTYYFNKERHETLNANGVFDTQPKIGTLTYKYDSRTYYMTAFYVEVAVANTIVKTKPADPESELRDALKNSLLLGNP